MSFSFPLGFLETDSGSPPVPPLLRVEILSSTLSGAFSGTEDWEDQNLDDMQANDGAVDWTYTPSLGIKPILSGGALVGPISGFPPGTDFAFTPIAATALELIMDMTVASDTWVNPGSRTADLFRIENEAGLGPGLGLLQFQLYEMTTTTAGIRLIVQQDGVGIVACGPATIPLDTRQTIGFKAINLAGAAFDVELTIDGVTVDSLGITWALNPISKITLFGGPSVSADFNPDIELFGYELNSIP